MGQVVEGIVPIDVWAIPHIDIQGFALADGEGQEVGQSLGSFPGIGHDLPVARQSICPLLFRTVARRHLAFHDVLFEHSPVEDILVTKQVLVVAQVMAVTHID